MANRGRRKIRAMVGPPGSTQHMPRSRRRCGSSSVAGTMAGTCRVSRVRLSTASPSSEPCHPSRTCLDVRPSCAWRAAWFLPAAHQRSVGCRPCDAVVGVGVGEGVRWRWRWRDAPPPPLFPPSSLLSLSPSSSPSLVPTAGRHNGQQFAEVSLLPPPLQLSWWDRCVGCCHRCDRSLADLML